MGKKKVVKKTKKENKNINERVEAFMRIIVAIVTGIILGIWKSLILILGVIHWFIVLFTGKRNFDLADFSEYWNSEKYRYMRYLTFVTNERPFPFTALKKLGNFVY